MWGPLPIYPGISFPYPVPWPTTQTKPSSTPYVNPHDPDKPDPIPKPQTGQAPEIETPIHNGFLLATRDGIVKVTLDGSSETLIPNPGYQWLDVEVYNEEIYVMYNDDVTDIEVYDESGNYLRSISIPSSINKLTNFTILPDSRIAIMDNDADKIYFINQSGTPLATVSMLHFSNSQAQNCYGVVVGNSLLLSEDGNRNVLKIDINTYEVSIFRNCSELERRLSPIAYHEGNYYLCGPQTIYEFNESTVDDPLYYITDISPYNITGMVIEGEHAYTAYVCINHSGEIYKIDLYSGAATLFASGINYPMDIEFLPN